MFCVIILPSGCCCVTRWYLGFYLGNVQSRCSHSLTCSFVVVFPFPHSTALPVLFLHECCALQVASLFTWGHVGFQRASFLCAKQEPGLSRRTCRPKFIVSLAWHKSLNASHSWRHWWWRCLSYVCNINASQRLSPLLKYLFCQSFNIQTACCGCVVHISLRIQFNCCESQNHELWLQTCPCFVSILPAGLLD